MNRQTNRALRLFLLLLSLGALACDAGDISALIGGSKPDIAIVSPPSGSIFHEGEEVAVQSTASDAKGIVRIELLVDGVSVRSDPSPTAQPKFSIIQTWKATQGTHTITVRAYNTANAGSDPAAISISVAPGIALNATPGVSSDVNPAPTAEPGTTPTSPSDNCTTDALFVADVTVPPGTVFAGGQTFNKIWRVQNTGTCAWGVGYDFSLVGGEGMNGPGLIAVPNTAPGATADLLVAMTAPDSAGTHSGQWRLRANGNPFGATLTISINIPAAPPPCPGPPVIASFSASPTTITAGSSTKLSWGAVTNATSAAIDHGIGGVATPGNKSVSPSSTTIYVLTATGCGGVATSQVTVTVNPGGPAPGNFGGNWDINFGTMQLNQTGTTVHGSYSNGSCNGTVDGTITGDSLDGSWAGCGGGPIHFNLAAGGTRFDGSYGLLGAKWCGARGGVSFASGCGFAGHWNLNTNGASQTADLTQTGNSVSGSYSNGTVSGTVTGWTLNGTYHSGNNTSTFIWKIDPTDLSFRGHWVYSGNSFNWCGWRSGQPSIPNTSACHE